LARKSFGGCHAADPPIFPTGVVGAPVDAAFALVVCAENAKATDCGSRPLPCAQAGITIQPVSIITNSSGLFTFFCSPSSICGNNPTSSHRGTSIAILLADSQTAA
jgi:hypothetical protein